MTTITENAVSATGRSTSDEMIAFVIMAVLLFGVPLPPIHPYFVMQALCFALFACAFNLLIGYGGLLSFGHAMFLGTGGYVTAHLLKVGAISLPYRPGLWFTIPFPPFSPEMAILG